MSLFSARSRHTPLSGSQGFTMVELIIAIAVFSIGLVGAYMMLDRTVFLASASQDEIIAANLMRGDIEEIKNLRDSNWVKLQSFSGIILADSSNAWLAIGEKYTLQEKERTVVWVKQSQLYFTKDPTDTKLCRKPDTPKYGYCDAIYTTQTKYRKYLKVEWVVNDDTSSTASLPNALKITSVVETDRPNRVYTLSTIITDWKKQ